LCAVPSKVALRDSTLSRPVPWLYKAQADSSPNGLTTGLLVMLLQENKGRSTHADDLVGMSDAPSF